MRSTYRDLLPQLEGRFLLADGGIETDLMFNRGWDLPSFAAFPLLETEAGRGALAAYAEEYVQEAAAQGTGVLIETATWRANPDWAAGLGYSGDQVDRANRDAVAALTRLRDHATSDAGRPAEFVISGCIGPRFDGYVVDRVMTAREAQDYHARQVDTFADTAADLVTAITMTTVEEAIGVARAAVSAEMPVVISFTVETDGRLPSGQPLGAAIDQVDHETEGTPAYFMINCAHPTHFASTLTEGGDWVVRIGGLRCNASALSHAELDEAETLDIGDPVDLGRRIADLKDVLPNLVVLGGCCGTDRRHVSAVTSAWLATA